MSTVSRRVVARTIAAKLVAEPKRQDYWLQVLAAYLIEHHRTDQADLIANDIAHELFVQNGQLLVQVESARPLVDGVRQALTDTLKQETGASQVLLDEHIDPALLGGLIARTPDALLDASVRTKLQQIATIK
jgi:F-type H+-transporting ATPase subunit delta